MKQSPIVHVVFIEGMCRYSQVFSPGLPDGLYDLYVEPRDDMLREAYMRGRTDECAMTAPAGVATELQLQAAYAEGRKDEREARAALIDAQIEAGWASKDAEGNNVGYGASLDGWKRAVRWALGGAA